MKKEGQGPRRRRAGSRSSDTQVSTDHTSQFPYKEAEGVGRDRGLEAALGPHLTVFLEMLPVVQAAPGRESCPGRGQDASLELGADVAWHVQQLVKDDCQGRVGHGPQDLERQD